MLFSTALKSSPRYVQSAAAVICVTACATATLTWPTMLGMVLLTMPPTRASTPSTNVLRSLLVAFNTLTSRAWYFFFFFWGGGVHGN